MADRERYESELSGEIVPLPDQAHQINPHGRREELPGLEADRHVTDWGQSERITRLADATLLRFLYSYWFRVEVDGSAHVPREGGAVLVANRAGQLPYDAAMILKALIDEIGRPVQFAAINAHQDVPGIGMLVTKLGGVQAHPANLQRLLFDEQALVLAFPERQGANNKPLRWRYRMRKFERLELLQAAMRAGVPIIPVAIVGTEEATPRLASFPPVKLPLLPRLPLSSPLPLPAKLQIRFLEPVETTALGDEPWRDRGLTAELAEDIRGLIQENLLEMVAARRSVWLG